MQGSKTICAVFLAACAAAAQAQWSVTNTLHIGGEGGWDYVTVDAANHRLLVTRSTHTQAIDVDSGKVLGDIPGQKRSHGTALVPAAGRGFITDGGSGAIVVFDLKTYAVLGTLAAMPDADGILYDKPDGLVLAVSGDGNALMTFKPGIDPAKDKVDPPIALGGSPEYLAYDGAGKVYINLADKDLVAVVDLKTRKVIARWPVAPGGRPVGMAIDRKGHRLLIGCRNPQRLVVLSTDTGKVVDSVPIGAGVDAVRFYDGRAFASCGDGTLTIAGEKDGRFTVEQVVKTLAGARTEGLDAATGTLYLPTADLQPAAGSKRPQPKPGTFRIVVVSRTAQ